MTEPINVSYATGITSGISRPLKTRPQFFFEWLEHKTSDTTMWGWKNFQVGDEVINVHTARRTSKNSASVDVDLRPINSDQTTRIENAITFDVVRLADKRIRITVTWNFRESGAVGSYFHKLLNDIEKDWPLPQRQSVQPTTPTSATGEGQNDVTNILNCINNSTHRTIAQLWTDYTAPEIGRKVSLSADRVNTLIWQLRKEHGQAVIPYKKRKR